MTAVGLLVTLLLKPAAVIVIAVTITTGMRRTSAAARHVVWSSAIATALIVPLLTFTLPAVRVEAPAWLWSTDRGTYVESVKVSVAQARTGGSASGRRMNAPVPEASKFTPRGSRNTDAGVAMVIFVWLVVAATLVTRRIAAERAVVRIARLAAPVNNRTRMLAALAARRQQLHAVPPVRFTDHIGCPAAIGITRAVVLLPRDAEQWPDDDLDRVLAHEFGHVARRDCLLNFCADVAVAIAWYNPLVHYAVRRMRLEAEQACDDSVLRTGAEAGAYAHLLLRIARADRLSGQAHGAATAMARARQLEERIVALLAGNAPRSPLSTAMVLVLVIGSTAFAVPVGTLTLVAAEMPAEQRLGPDRLENSPGLAPEPDQLGDSLALPASERIPGASLRTRSVEEALRGPDSVLARVLASGLEREPENDADLVRERAAWALSQTEDGRLVEPLLEMLDAADWRTQSYAAWSLALTRDPRAVPRLIPLLSHSVWRMRAMAAYALRESRDPSAMAPMTAALSDPAWQVRLEAVEYLAALGGTEAEPLLHARLSDRHVAVRLAAQRAITPP